MKFEDMLADLKREYLQSFPEKFQTINSHIDAKDNELLRDDFHKLKGTGKTYGIPEISELCMLVESVCKTKPEKSIACVQHSLPILKRIVDSNNQGQAYNLQTDEDYKSLVAGSF